MPHLHGGDAPLRTTGIFFFPSPYGGRYPERTIYAYFRRFLWEVGISHGGRGKGPRVHDLRHAFAVHCLKRWVRNAVDLTVALPYLSAYLGHEGLKGTQRYLRLTSELYPDIVARHGRTVRASPAGWWPMKTTDFARYLTNYLSLYLPGERNLSSHTIASYRDTFKLLLIFCENKKGISPEGLTLAHIDDDLIRAFITWIETTRNCSVATRNQRLAAVHAFFRYIQAEMPERLTDASADIGYPAEEDGEAGSLLSHH